MLSTKMMLAVFLTFIFSAPNKDLKKDKAHAINKDKEANPRKDSLKRNSTTKFKSTIKRTCPINGLEDRSLSCLPDYNPLRTLENFVKNNMPIRNDISFNNIFKMTDIGKKNSNSVKNSANTAERINSVANSEQFEAVDSNNENKPETETRKKKQSNVIDQKCLVYEYSIPNTSIKTNHSSDLDLQAATRAQSTEKLYQGKINDTVFLLPSCERFERTQDCISSNSSQNTDDLQFEFGQNSLEIYSLDNARRLTERRIFKSPFLLYTDEEIKKINTTCRITDEHKSKQLLLESHQTIYKYYYALIYNQQETNTAHFRHLFDTLLNSTNYNISKEDLVTALMKDQNITANFLIKITVMKKMISQECVFDRKFAYTADDLNFIELQRRKNFSIPCKEYINPNMLTILQNLNSINDVLQLNHEYKTALKTFFFNANTSTGFNLNTINLMKLVPEILFFLEWVTVDTNIDYNLTHLIIIEEIDQIQRLAYLCTKYDNKHIDLKSAILFGEVAMLRILMYERIIRVAPNTMQLGLYRLAMYYEYEHTGAAYCSFDRLHVLFLFAFSLEFDGQIYDLMRKYMLEFNDKREIKDSLWRVLCKMANYKNVNPKIMQSLIFIINYLETRRAYGFKYKNIHMLIPYYKKNLIVYSENGIEKKVVNIFSTYECIIYLYMRIEELLSMN